jgi:hypothetical protein
MLFRSSFANLTNLFRTTDRFWSDIDPTLTEGASRALEGTAQQAADGVPIVVVVGAAFARLRLDIGALVLTELADHFVLSFQWRSQQMPRRSIHSMIPSDRLLNFGVRSSIQFRARDSDHNQRDR